MAISFSRPDPSSPTAVSEATFSTGRRGFDQQEVRDFLRMVAAELARLQERERFLERELRDLQRRVPSLSGAVIDEETATRLLGEETARILHTAREGAGAIRAKAEDGAARLLREASDDAQRQREEADLEASRRRSDAASDAEAELAMAKQQGREMVEEARAYRERVLGELSRRRELARQQIENLVHGRDRLLQAFERARLVAVDVLAEMTPVGEPEEFVDLSPTTGPVPIMVPADRIGDAGSIDESVLRPAALPQPDAPAVEDEIEDEIDDDEVTDIDVAHLFARLRAARVEPPPEPAATEVHDPDEDVEETPFRRRDAALTPLIVGAARKLKRALADEQNDVLDTLRRREPVTDVETLLPAFEQQVGRYADSIATELVAAAEAGATSMSMAPDTPSDSTRGEGDELEAVRESLSAQLVEPLRERLVRAVTDGEGDNDAITKRVRAVYREWKTQRIDEQLDDLFRLAHSRGAIAAVPSGSLVQWSVDPDGPPSPDCEDNALNGPTPLGEAFPSGHRSPPMHAGCRCLLLMARS